MQSQSNVRTILSVPLLRENESVGAIALRRTDLGGSLAAAAMLTLAIVSHHFTAMGAVSIVPDPDSQMAASALPTSWLAIAVALASFAIILLTFAGLSRVKKNWSQGWALAVIN